MRYLPSQQPVTDFGLACNRKFKTASGEQREEVLFVDCSAFGRTAEIINQYCTKGKPIFVEGRLKYETWEDKNGGGKRHKISVQVENFSFWAAATGRSPAAAMPRHRGRTTAPPTGKTGAIGWRWRRPPRAAAPPQTPPYGDEQQFKDDDIPF